MGPSHVCYTLERSTAADLERRKTKAGIENSYVVTSNGPEKLTRFDDRIQVLP
ncbi:MAG: hypothetical protein AB1733_18225 [Thermodesulfobacteriota bacterium]